MIAFTGGRELQPTHSVSQYAALQSAGHELVLYLNGKALFVAFNGICKLNKAG